MTIGMTSMPGPLLVAFVYAGAAWLARGAARRKRRDRHRPTAWRMIALLLALFALIRLFDIEEHLSRLAAAQAGQAGWYRDRAPVQRIAVAIVAAVGLVCAAGAAAAMRRLGLALAVASAATAVLIVLAALHIVSLHATDHLLQSGWGPLTRSRLIEAGALAVLLVTAAVAGRARR